ncbi:unnamed protein product [Lepeophtheirus salmonis]|uniref:(salmon louse) hypothetical protein n=1 Tax=Lepeophtheirus salmonis TaxID=72036 RepID=A0A7R8CSN9_LEPSM|nr:unnamed protein product [Lepeophtheirus salmonis]CAF2918922.1 unnamed protein product [Lepeophtheirus salmonis]
MKSTPHYFRIGIGSDGKTEFNFESFLDTVRKDRVLVIGVSGKSHFGDGKGSFVDHYIQKDAFGPWNEMDESGEDFVEGVHDPSSNLIFLHLKNFHDGSNLLHGIQKMKDMGVQAYLAQGRETTVLMNLFLFHTLRWEFMSQISKIMNCCDFPQEKVTNGRFLTPRLLFYFPTPPQALRVLYTYDENNSKRKEVEKYQDIQMFESNLSSDIICLWNRASMSSVTLFKIPIRQEFCFVELSQSKVLHHDIFTFDWNELYKSLGSFEINDDYDSPFVPYYEDIALDESLERIETFLDF